MRVRVLVSMVVVLLIVALTPICAETTKAELQEKYMGILKDEGYAPKLDKDGDIQFKYEGKSFYIIIDEEDPEFFELMYPSFWSIESEEERVKVTNAAAYATADTKVAKIYPVDDDTTAVVEILISEPEDIRPHFGRMLRMIRSAVDTFKTKMNE